MAKGVNKRKSLTIQLSGMSVNGITALFMGYAVTQFPFLAFGPIDDIISFFMKRVLTKWFESGTIGFNSIIINVDVNADVKALKIAQRDSLKPGLTKEEINAQDRAIKDAIRDLATIGRAPL